MHSCGNRPPTQIKSKFWLTQTSYSLLYSFPPWFNFTQNQPHLADKDKYIDTERRRWSRYFSVPMVENMPKGFPPITLAVQRALCAISLKSPHKLIPVFDALYRSFWVEGNEKIGQPEVFLPVLEKVLGKDEADEIFKAVCFCLNLTLVNCTMDIQYHTNHATLCVIDDSTSGEAMLNIKHRASIQIRCIWPSLVRVYELTGWDWGLLGRWSFGSSGRLLGIGSEFGQGIQSGVVRGKAVNYEQVSPFKHLFLHRKKPWGLGLWGAFMICHIFLPGLFKTAHSLYLIYEVSVTKPISNDISIPYQKYVWSISSIMQLLIWIYFDHANNLYLSERGMAALLLCRCLRYSSTLTLSILSMWLLSSGLGWLGSGNVSRPAYKTFIWAHIPMEDKSANWRISQRELTNLYLTPLPSEEYPLPRPWSVSVPQHFPVYQ